MDILIQICGFSSIAAILYLSVRFMQEPFNKIIQCMIVCTYGVLLFWLLAYVVSDTLTRFGVL